MYQQIAGMKAPSFVEDKHQLGEYAQSGNSDAVTDAVLQVADTEQSDFELAYALARAGACSAAAAHVYSRPVQPTSAAHLYSRPVLTGLLRAKQKPRQAAGTLHAFFKKV